MRAGSTITLAAVLLFCGVAAADAGPDASVSDAATADASCGNVDTLGECMGRRLRACVDGKLAETDCAQAFGTGFTCRLVGDLQAAQCVFSTTDAGIVLTDGSAGGAPDDASINPLPPDDGCDCVRPNPVGTGTGAGAIAVFAAVLRRRKTPASDKDAPV